MRNDNDIHLQEYSVPLMLHTNSCATTGWAGWAQCPADATATALSLQACSELLGGSPLVMPPQLRLNAVAFISSQNHPILIRTFTQARQDDLKYHYIAHTSLDVIDERSASVSVRTPSRTRITRSLMREKNKFPHAL